MEIECSSTLPWEGEAHCEKRTDTDTAVHVSSRRGLIDQPTRPTRRLGSNRGGVEGSRVRK